MEESKRIDKWLWEVRIFKTRTQATEACRAGRIRILDAVVKPSRELQAGDEIAWVQQPVTRTFRVLGFPRSRVGAALVPDFMQELTSPEEILKQKMMREMHFEQRDRGVGRPTKRQRRDIEALKKRWSKDL